MAFDGTVTRAVTMDIKEQLTGGRVAKIHQPHELDIVMTIRAAGKNHSLFFSVNPSFARFHLTNIKFQNPQEPPLFCMVLRKHLEGAVLESVEQDGLERVITFSFKGMNELGDVSYKKLILELMGRHSNFIFVDEEKGHILESIKHIPPSLSQVRTVLPGQPYTEPPNMDKKNPLTASREELLKTVDFNAGKMDKQLMKAFSGLSPQLAAEIVHRAGYPNAETLPAAFEEVAGSVRDGSFYPQRIRGEKKEAFAVVDMTHIQGEKTTYDTVHALLDDFYGGKAERDRVRQQAYDLERLLKNEYEKNKKKIKKLENTLTDAEKAAEMQKYGELLTAHMHMVKPGMTEISVVDYYDDEQGEVTIPLSNRLTPSENAQQYFRRYHKLKNSVSYVKTQIRHAGEEMEYLDRLLQQMDVASTTDIEDIREELSTQGYIKRRRQPQKKKPKKPSLDHYRSTSGIDLYVGKNNRQNEYLTTRMARQDDTWLHVKDIPGSHVLIRSVEPDDETIMEAAMLAAYFSKSRMSGNVPVDFTKIRYVKKPNGAKPGYVTYDRQTTVFTTPDETEIKRLKKNTLTPAGTQ
ncbi:Rqc2 family fibronectin-binding protein [Alkalicoccus urumqiensis]|uniref:Rqc2 homolog RqcH n=1 Tax=Alkalicoccus urumqiensis TaxID=1548213 RepID=A0A2P6MG79_ALKUR|nr:NFACT RNA binding domain-containing protein [Alkalicoccus urumqiensis]PRO65284.1 hypothetical protein C6I21_10820 [Alkalicoccus urumqiensis]